MKISIEKNKLKTTLNISPGADLESNVVIIHQSYCYDDRLVKSSITTIPEIRSLNKYLRNSEAGDWRGDWSGFKHLAKYFMDQAGTFEIPQWEDGEGKCLMQVVRQKGIHTTVFTVIGDNK